MLNYNFYDLLEKSCRIPTHMMQYFEGLGIKSIDICPKEPVNEEYDTISVLWDEVVKRHNCLFPLFSPEDMFEPFKREVILSIFASLSYTTAKTVTKSDIANSYIKVDVAAKSNEDTQNSIKASVGKHSRAIGSIPNVNITGQYVDTNALQYFVPFGIPDKEFKVFDLLDFYYYQDRYTIWPFYEVNKNGMNLESLVKGYNHFLENKKDTFSAYIFEELFQPIRLTSLVSDFISVFGELFYKYQEPSREHALRLLCPFYRLPLAVQRLDSGKYCKALKTYIMASEKERNTAWISYLKELKSILFRSYCIFPLLQTTMSRALYTFMEGDLNEMKSCLGQYIKRNPSEFSYDVNIENSLKQLASLEYPLSPKKQRNGEGGSTKVADSQEKKRNNKAIKTFDINLTNAFYNQPHIYDLLEYNFPNTGWSIEMYMLNLQNVITSNAKCGASDQTYNYLQYLRMENKDY